MPPWPALPREYRAEAWPCVSLDPARGKRNSYPRGSGGYRGCRKLCRKILPPRLLARMLGGTGTREPTPATQSGSALWRRFGFSTNLSSLGTVIEVGDVQTFVPPL